MTPPLWPNTKYWLFISLGIFLGWLLGSWIGGLISSDNQVWGVVLGFICATIGIWVGYKAGKVILG